MATDRWAIRTHDLRKDYKGFTALKGLNLEVPRHAIFGFLGPNGAGKSTTIKLLLGLIRPTGGSGTVLGHDLVLESLDVRRRVGYLPQSPEFYPHMTARETLRFAARFFLAEPPGAIEKRVAESLELVGLTARADRPVGTLSGGERQRLGIAQAQIHHPDLLILDEPAAALDPQGRRDVLDIMRQLRERTTIFYSTHILDDVQRVSDAVAILNQGELVAQAPVAQLLAGSGRTVFQVSLKGQADRARARVVAQPWVADLQVLGAAGMGQKDQGNAGEVHWAVTVADEAAAERHLLRTVLAEPGCIVTEFRRRRYNLEEIFLQLVGKNGGQDHGE